MKDQREICLLPRTCMYMQKVDVHQLLAPCPSGVGGGGGNSKGGGGGGRRGEVTQKGGEVTPYIEEALRGTREGRGVRGFHSYRP